MDIAETLARRAPSPSADSWLMIVRESDLLFASWPLPIGEIRPVVPAALGVSTCEGQAWVTVEALQMDVLQFRNMPPLPRPMRGSQVNVRTYVEYQGQQGIYFLSLDCPGAIGSALGRLLFKLPFNSANVSVRLNGNNYHVESTRVRRGGPPAGFAASAQIIGPPSPVQPGSVDAFLLNQTCLFGVKRNGSLFRGDVAHRDRVIQPLSGLIEANTLTAASGVRVPQRPPLLQYSPGDDSLAWPFVPVRPSAGEVRGRA